jgi:hypothetical protein
MLRELHQPVPIPTWNAAMEHSKDAGYYIVGMRLVCIVAMVAVLNIAV